MKIIEQVSLPLAMAYAGTSINACVFRASSLVSDKNKQYTTFYDPEGCVVVAVRSLKSATWEYKKFDIKGNIHDAHNSTVLGLSGDGILHLSYNHHNHPLHYRRSSKPGDIHAFGPEQGMTGKLESKLCYPAFLTAPDGNMLFFYRDGGSGKGRYCLNRYEIKDGTWHPLHHPLIEGGETSSPYPHRICFGADGSLHLAWCWRDSGRANTNHDICYTRSMDGGRSWQRSDGSPQALPITLENAEIIHPIPINSNLINSCSLTVDGKGRPHLAHYHNGDNGIPQYFHLWHDAGKWKSEQVSRRTLPFQLAGTGTLKLLICRPEILVTKNDTVVLITRDAEFGSVIRLYWKLDGKTEWQTTDLTQENMGQWEPNYDIERWNRDGVLSLFVLPVRQENSDNPTDFRAQMASILEQKLQ